MYKSIDDTRIRNLKVVAMLKQGDRLRTRAHHYSVDTYASIFSYKPLYRFLTGEGKEETVDSLSKLISSCVKQVGLTEKDKGRLCKQMKEVILGVNNLSVTYKDDSTACAGLSFIKEMIEDFIVSVDPTYIRETNATEVECDTEEEDEKPMPDIPKILNGEEENEEDGEELN
jgi:hypothetical protein